MTLLVAVLFQIQLPFVPPTTGLTIVNGETQGYIVVVANGKEVLVEISGVAEAKDGTLQPKQQRRVWEAGPQQAIVLTRRNWTTSTGEITVFVKYYDNNGRFVGVSRARRFPVSASEARSQIRWVFTQADLVR